MNIFQIVRNIRASLRQLFRNRLSNTDSIAPFVIRLPKSLGIWGQYLNSPDVVSRNISFVHALLARLQMDLY